MVVPIQRPRIRVHGLDEFGAVFAHAVVIGEHAEVRVVQHVEFSLEVLHPENRVQLFGKHRPPPVRVNTNDPAFLSVRVRGADVHRVFRDKHASVRRDTDHGWMTNLRRLCNEVHPPVRWRRWR